jgi:carboxylesterase type B
MYYRYLAGAASSFNGEDIIRQSNRGVVVVLIQYRLGVFGKIVSEILQANTEYSS